MTAQEFEFWYHGTFENFTGNFLPMSHFGTRQAALDLLHKRYREDGCMPPATLYTVRLMHKTPWDIADTDSPEPNVIVGRLKEQGLLTDTQANEAKKEMRLHYGGSDYGRRHERTAYFARYLQENFNCDSLRYVNEHEDKGSSSVSILDPRLINIVAMTILDQSFFDDAD